MPQNRLIALSFSMFVLTHAAVGSAQDARGAINGTVTDQSGGIVPGVSIRVTNADTGVSVDATTNAYGAYDVPFLLPGTYSVSAELAGFKKATRSGIRVDVGAHAGADFALEIGSTLEAVTVSAAPPLLESTSADLGQVIPTAYITDVGTSIFRNAANFVRLAPGVTGQSQGTYTSDNQTAVSNGGGGGRRAATNGSRWRARHRPLSTGSRRRGPAGGCDRRDEGSHHHSMHAYGHSMGGAVTIVTKAHQRA